MPSLRSACFALPIAELVSQIGALVLVELAVVVSIEVVLDARAQPLPETAPEIDDAVEATDLTSGCVES
jgi:hypothetical protein